MGACSSECPDVTHLTCLVAVRLVTFRDSSSVSLAVGALAARGLFICHCGRGHTPTAIFVSFAAGRVEQGLCAYLSAVTQRVWWSPIVEPLYAALITLLC